MKTVNADPMPGIGLSYIKGDAPVAKSGQTYPVWTNSHGAVTAVMEDGTRLGLRPAEFEIESWHHLAAAPAPQPHPEPIAWMVGTAFWWTKEEAERDAAASGKTITPFGPMFDTVEVERLRAEVKRANQDKTAAVMMQRMAEQKLAERNALLRKIASIPGDSINYHATHMSRIARAALSASVEPSPPAHDPKLIGVVHTPPAEYDEP
ncbi:hypothetical protein LVS58_07020 [Pseudomonas sp. JR33AA]|nr:hypothetical protein [Pseudomonas sp. JR33AA]